MPRHPSLNDTLLKFSASLAASIGVNEAILLTLLNDAATLQSQPWARLNSQILRQQLPFWDDATIRQTLQNLQAQGFINIQGALFPDANDLYFNFVQQSDIIQQSTAVTYEKIMPALPQTDNTLSHWQPTTETLQRLQQHGIESSFALSHLDAFILQAKEQRAQTNDLNARFFRYVKSQWVYAQNRSGAERERTSFQPTNKEPVPIQGPWQPDSDAVSILERDGVDPAFIKDAVAEFILYWRERGQAHNTWNSKFVQHVRLQWHRFVATEEHGAKPMPIPPNWRPSDDCFDIIAMAYIDKNFAEQLVPEFVLYWHDSKQIHTSWNSRFLQFVKQRWGTRLAHTGGQHGQATNQPSYTSAEASLQRLKDTSW